jgi:DNA replication protein DnaC
MEQFDYDKWLRDLIQKNEEEAKKELAMREIKKREELINNSGLGKRFRKRTFERFEINKHNQEAYNKSLDFAENFTKKEKGLIFVGPYGTGKTHLAAAIANYLIKNLYSVVFGNITNIITKIKSTYNKDSDLSERDIIDILSNVDLLILDDLGKENTTENTSTLIYQIINNRYEDEKPILVTTNLKSNELARKLGEKGLAIVSRLFEMCDPVVMNGQDWRMKNV